MTARRRIPGRLWRSQRGLMLDAQDGTIWALRVEEDMSALVGREVVVEGTVIAASRLAVDWVGPSGLAPVRRDDD